MVGNSHCNSFCAHLLHAAQLSANKVGRIGHCIQTGTNKLINDVQLLQLREIDSGTTQSGYMVVGDDTISLIQFQSR